MERPRDALAQGTEIGGYVIADVLGRGGFAITYAATDALRPDVRVAIKEFLPAGLAVREAGSVTVHPASADEAEEFAKALERFQDEARTLVALNHPNIIDAERFIKANGTAYVVMKYEEGMSLGGHIEGGKRLSESALRHILPGLLDGLEAVHSQDFLHRDIKPDNIYLRSEDGSPVLIDFGAARQAIADEGRTSLTELVTPGYAPYEQYDRYSLQGHYTDIYALGATLYRCVTGQRPPEATSRINALARKVDDPIVPAAVAARGSYSPVLLEAIDRAMAVFENERPQSVAEFRRPLGLGGGQSAETLNLARTPETASTTPRLEVAPDAARASARPRLRSSRVLAGVLVLLAMAGGGYYAWSRYAPDAAKTDEAARKMSEQRARAGAEAKRKADEAVRKKAAEDRQRAEAEVKKKAEEETKKKAEEEARRKAEREKAEADTKLCRQGAGASAAEIVAACTRIASDSARPPPEIADALAFRAQWHNQQRNYPEALADCRRAISLNAENARAHHACGVALFQQKDFRHALQSFGRAVELDPHDVYLAYRGHTLLQMGEYQRAIADLDRAIAKAPKGDYYSLRGAAYYQLGQYQRAIPDFTKAIELDPKDAEHYNLRGASYFKLGQFQNAIQDYGKTIELNPKHFHAHYNRGLAHENMGNRRLAIPDYQAAARLGNADAKARLRALGVD